MHITVLFRQTNCANACAQCISLMSHQRLNWHFEVAARMATKVVDCIGRALSTQAIKTTTTITATKKSKPVIISYLSKYKQRIYLCLLYDFSFFLSFYLYIGVVCCSRAIGDLYADISSMIKCLLRVNRWFFFCFFSSCSFIFFIFWSCTSGCFIEWSEIIEWNFGMCTLTYECKSWV